MDAMWDEFDDLKMNEGWTPTKEIRYPLEGAKGKKWILSWVTRYEYRPANTLILPNETQVWLMIYKMVK